jgi:hypothetical protein
METQARNLHPLMWIAAVLLGVAGCSLTSTRDESAGGATASGFMANQPGRTNRNGPTGNAVALPD